MSNKLFNIDVYREVMIDAMLELNDVEYALEGDPHDLDMQDAAFDLSVVVEESFQRYLNELFASGKESNGK